ncbi:hypothetical protein BD410DRAFT_683929, partial [Rickenella mellea]
ALIDSGASDNFVSSFAVKNTPLDPLPSPITLRLLDGGITRAGSITHSFSTTLTFPKGEKRIIRFLVTDLHPSAPIVLGLSWLRTENPTIDWS